MGWIVMHATLICSISVAPKPALNTAVLRQVADACGKEKPGGGALPPPGADVIATFAQSVDCSTPRPGERPGGIPAEGESAGDSVAGHTDLHACGRRYLVWGSKRGAIGRRTTVRAPRSTGFGSRRQTAPRSTWAGYRRRAPPCRSAPPLPVRRSHPPPACPMRKAVAG